MSPDIKLQILNILMSEPEAAPAPTRPAGFPSASGGYDPIGQHIAVLDRGYVYVGEISWKDEWMVIDNARNIRIWGTKEGLGELRTGPTSETVLDKCDQVIVPRRSIQHLTPCKGF